MHPEVSDRDREEYLEHVLRHSTALNAVEVAYKGLAPLPAPRMTIDKRSFDTIQAMVRDHRTGSLTEKIERRIAEAAERVDQAL